MNASSFQQKLQNGEITVSGDDLPSFLYNESEGFKPTNLFYNLLRSPVLVWVSPNLILQACVFSCGTVDMATYIYRPKHCHEGNSRVRCNERLPSKTSWHDKGDTTIHCLCSGSCKFRPLCLTIV